MSCWSSDISDILAQEACCFSLRRDHAHLLLSLRRSHTDVLSSLCRGYADLPSPLCRVHADFPSSLCKYHAHLLIFLCGRHAVFLCTGIMLIFFYHFPEAMLIFPHPWAGAMLIFWYPCVGAILIFSYLCAGFKLCNYGNHRWGLLCLLQTFFHLLLFVEYCSDFSQPCLDNFLPTQHPCSFQFHSTKFIILAILSIDASLHDSYFLSCDKDNVKNGNEGLEMPHLLVGFIIN
jgi:hypothetical protein